MYLNLIFKYVPFSKELITSTFDGDRLLSYVLTLIRGSLTFILCFISMETTITMVL